MFSDTIASALQGKFDTFAKKMITMPLRCLRDYVSMAPIRDRIQLGHDPVNCE
ncbi:hypothetical protein ABIB34_002471 [Rhodococcus sp. UYP5]